MNKVTTTFQIKESAMDKYNGKNVYLGIDVHKRTYSLTAIVDGEVIKKDTILAEPLELVKYCKKFFPGASIYSAYEAGFCGFSLHRKLNENGINNVVVNPASIEVAARERVKTDKRDSFKIADQLSVGRLKGIHVPSVAREQLRLVSRLYECYVQHRHRTGCQLKSLLYQFGLIKRTDKFKVSKKWIQSVLKLDCAPAIKYSIKEFSQHWLYLNKRMEGVKKELELQAQVDAKIHGCYTSFFGVGLVTARILANELEDMSHFSNEKKLYSYTGLTPREYSSGDHQRLGHISHQGKPILRKILVQIAWKITKKDPELQEIFLKIAAKAGKKRAIIAIARKLLVRMRACLREGRNYKVHVIDLSVQESGRTAERSFKKQ